MSSSEHKKLARAMSVAESSLTYAYRTGQWPADFDPAHWYVLVDARSKRTAIQFQSLALADLRAVADLARFLSRRKPDEFIVCTKVDGGPPFIGPMRLFHCAPGGDA